MSDYRGDINDVKAATDDASADFEGQRLSGHEKISDIADVKSTTDDDTADFEGHRLSGPEKISKIAKAG